VLGTWHSIKSYLKIIKKCFFIECSTLALGNELFKKIKKCFFAKCSTLVLGKKLFEKIVYLPSAVYWHSAKSYLKK